MTRVAWSSRALLVLLAVLSLAPVLALIVQAIATSWRFPALVPADAGLDAFANLLVSYRLRAALLMSLGLALATGAISMVLGFWAGRALSGAVGAVRRVGAMAAFLPVVAPPIALGIGLQVAVLAAGLGGDWQGVLLAHLVPATGYVTLYFLGVLSAYDAGMEEEARTLGANRWQVLRRITVPALRRRLAEALVLGALVSWGQLALTLLVGGGAVRTLPVELLSLLQAGDDRVGAAAAVALTIPPLLALGLLQVSARRAGSHW